MKFLIPRGGVIHPEFAGCLTTYKHRGIPSHITKRGGYWAGDNCAFKDFSADKFTTWIERMTPYRGTCLFIACPDVVADHGATLARWYEWRDRLSFWPLAFVGQDGCAPDQIPDDCAAVFIGGSTAWKMSQTAVDCIEWGIENGKHIHIGRVNYWKRYEHFRSIPGSDAFTCDGTRIAFQANNAIKDWRKYQNAAYNLRFDLSFRDSCG